MIGKLDLLGGMRTFVNAAAASPSTYYSEPFGVGGGVSGDLQLEVLGIFGTTPTVDVTIEHSNDLSTWSTLVSFTQAVAISSESKALSGFFPNIRAKLEIDGTDMATVLRLKGVIRAS